MLADPNHARRPALPRGRQRLMAALFCVPLVLFPALASANPAGAAVSAAAGPAAAAAVNDTVALQLAPNSTILRLNEDLVLSVKVTNDSSSALSAGEIDVYLAERALSEPADLDAWLHPDDDDDNAGDLMTSVPLAAAVPAHGTVTVTVTVPNAALGLFEWSPWGPRGIRAALSTDDSVRASDRSTFVWYPDAAAQPPVVTPVNLATIVPITIPGNSTGLISGEDLTAYTAESGSLTRQLDGVLNRAVVIAIDPMIIASIRVLGTSAPASATSWLDRLANAENDIFPLGYADADPSLATQSGAPGPLTPTSFSFATDPNLFVPTEPDAQSAPAEAAVDPDIPEPTSTEPTPTPEVPEDGSVVPTPEQLLAWDYTSTAIAWPADNTVARTDLAAFAAAGLTTTILAAGNVAQDDAEVTPDTTVQLESNRLALVADAALSEAMRSAVTATSDEDWRGFMADVSSRIAMVAADNPGQARTLLATLDRNWPPTAERVAQTVDALTALPWYSPTTLTQAAATPVSTDVEFLPRAQPSGSVDLARRLLDREAELGAFSEALADPAAVTAPNRLAVLALLGTSWPAAPDEWRTAVGENLAASHQVMRSVSVSTKGPINVVGSKVDIPVTLNNALGQAVTVRVQVVPSNGRLLVGDDVVAVLDASSAKTVSVPVTAAVGNGAVSLRVTLFTPSGAAMGPPSPIAVNVRADWEGIGSRIFAALIVLFFGFGIWRNIVHRRRDRAQVADGESTATASTGAAADPAPPADAAAVDPAPGTPPVAPDDLSRPSRG